LMNTSFVGYHSWGCHDGENQNLWGQQLIFVAIHFHRCV
jgi:hypothetical protein